MNDDLPDSDHDFEDSGYEAQVSLAWQDALEWACKGDVPHLAKLLRSDVTLLDNAEVRGFLADVLEKKHAFPRGRQVRRPEKTFGYDASGQIAMIATQHVQKLGIRKWVRENRAALGDRVYDEAANHFKVRIETIENAVRRSANAWNRPGSI